MSHRPRLKRQVAKEATPIIEILDSGEEDASEPAAKKQRTATNRRVDKAAEQVAGRIAGGTAETSRQRWPTKGKNQTLPATANTNDTPENSTQPNVARQVAADGGTNSRSSFWGRRKVWSIGELLAETQQIDNRAANNIVQLFQNENTIPFICRYRRDIVGELTPERLRDIKAAYGEFLALRRRAETLASQLERDCPTAGQEVANELLCAKSSEELEFIYAPYKPASKGTLAERAKALGLEVYANRILYGTAPKLQDLEGIVQRNNAALDSVEKVTVSICHLIAHNISKHKNVLEELRRLRTVHRIVLKSSMVKANAASSNKSSKHEATPKVNGNSDASKFQNYFDYQADVRALKPHQVLAINRGEKLKFLKVSLDVPDHLKQQLKRFVRCLYLNEGLRYHLREQLFESSFEECYGKKLQPLLRRQIRADLNDSAKRAAIDVFARNLKQLLLMSPLKGERILGIDPGFTHGCKLAVVSETGDVLETLVIYPHSRNTDPESCGQQLVKLLLRHNCKVIALGNGTACRETEAWLTKLFEVGMFDHSGVRYSIVSEQGASIYSCSQMARQEFPEMDVNEISAVSIARRLIDPLSEWIKIEARHIGVGMYQHDVNEKALTETLNEVVSECVSYVGVDLNTASLSALKHVAGLSEKKAMKIIEHRTQHGPFRTRGQLKDVKTIGEKTYIQCAGFVRIEPRTLGDELENAFDSTWVHPESYEVARKIIAHCELKSRHVGREAFIARIKTFAAQCNMDELAFRFQLPKERLEIVLLALQRSPQQDYRCDLDMRPHFKRGIVRLRDLSVGETMTGAITNITHFGAFVDIGVECDALLHSSQMAATNLMINDRITVTILQLDMSRRRIGLKFVGMQLSLD